MKRMFGEYVTFYQIWEHDKRDNVESIIIQFVYIHNIKDYNHRITINKLMNHATEQIQEIVYEI